MKDKRKLNLCRTNFIILLVGLFVITLGYIVMKVGDVTVSPILLVLGYCVIIPISLVLPVNNKK